MVGFNRTPLLTSRRQTYILIIKGDGLIQCGLSAPAQLTSCKAGWIGALPAPGIYYGLEVTRKGRSAV